MATKSIPYLSRIGWMKNPELIITKLYEYFLLSEYSQSNIYLHDIASLKYILQHNHTTQDIKNSMRTTLINMYSRYYDQVDVTIDITETDNSTSYNVNIICILNNKTYSLIKMLTTDVNNNVTNMDTLLTEINE